jgi:hypothetical protein
MSDDHGDGRRTPLFSTSAHSVNSPSPEIDSLAAASRAYRDHDVVGCGYPVPPADDRRRVLSRHEAWLYLWSEAAPRGGSVAISAARLARTFNWTVKTSRTFLAKLEAHGLITRSRPGRLSRLTTTISIVDQATPHDNAIDRKVRAAMAMSQTLRRAS